MTESLAGRCAVLALPTLSLAEATPQATGHQTDTFCWRGGFPGLWHPTPADLDLWFGSYLATYLERDVRNLAQIANLRDFGRFLRAIAIRVGQQLSLSTLARDVGIAPNTARSWFAILTTTHQVLVLEPYHRSLGTRLVKTPKLYLADPGLLLHLLGFRDWDAVPQHAMRGAIWENLVVSEVWKFFQNRGERPPCRVWRRVQTDPEIDLLLELAPTRVAAIECKTASQPDRASCAGFRAFTEAYGPQAITRAAVVCRTEAPTRSRRVGRSWRCRSAVPRGSSPG